MVVAPASTISFRHSITNSKLSRIYFSKDSKSENSKNASRAVLKEFQDMIQQKYNSIFEI